MKRQLAQPVAASASSTPGLSRKRKRLLARRDASCCYGDVSGEATMSPGGVGRGGIASMGPPIPRLPSRKLKKAPAGFSLLHASAGEISSLLSLGWRPTENEVKALKATPGGAVDRCIDVLDVLLEEGRRYSSDASQRWVLARMGAIEAVLTFYSHASGPRCLACRAEELLQKASYSEATQKAVLDAISRALRSQGDPAVGPLAAKGSRPDLYSSLQRVAVAPEFSLDVRQHAVTCMQANVTCNVQNDLACEGRLVPWRGPLSAFRESEFRTTASVSYVAAILGLLVSISSVNAGTACAVLKFLGREVISLLASPAATVREGAAKVLLAESRASDSVRLSLAKLAALPARRGSVLLRLFIGVIDRAPPMRNGAVEDICSLLVDLVGQENALSSFLHSIGVIPALRARMRLDGEIGIQAQALLNLTLSAGMKA